MKNTWLIVGAAIIIGLAMIVVVSMKNNNAAPTPFITPSPTNTRQSFSSNTGLVGTWQWSKRDVNGDTLIDASQEEYTISFLENGDFQAQADCNVVLGTYLIDSDENQADQQIGVITFQPQPTTIAECGQTSLYNDMIDTIRTVQNYRLTDNNQTLIFIWPTSDPLDYYVRIE